ncbi:response regulator [Haladaptatus sp. W1]|uniref:response regulator n=1 Tax=Haladaptatus sp. W1 TaxID=1897478 RepID=UPI0020C7F228|nr:response regulator [Haladaptatus sp. W1]
MMDDIRVLFVDPLSDAGVFPGRLADAIDSLSVVEARTTDEALDVLSERRIDCVISAYALPDSDGIELLHAVRQTRLNLPYILCTESGSEKIASRAISAGVTEYLRAGGIDLETLAKRVERIVSPSETSGTDRRFNHYRSIVQAMGDGVYTLDTNGRMTAVNDTLVDISGYERDELVGEHISMLLDDEDVERGTNSLEASSVITTPSVSYWRRFIRWMGGPSRARPASGCSRTTTCFAEPWGCSEVSRSTNTSRRSFVTKNDESRNSTKWHRRWSRAKRRTKSVN